MRTTTNSFRRRALAVSTAAVAALTFAACSDDGGDENPAPDNSQMIPNSSLPVTLPPDSAGG